MQKNFLKPKILILHGWGGSDFPHWQSWLSMKLANEGYPVYFPQLPFMHTPRKKVWLECLEEAIDKFAPDRIVCHSLGNTLWFWYADKYPNKIFEKVLLVAPPSNKTDIKAIDTFFKHPKPASLSQNTLLVVSSNDKYLTEKEAKVLSEELNCELKIMQNAGHINADSGFGSFEFALDWISA